jgi:hypothetical protein
VIGMLVIGLTRAAVPIPRHPAARIKRAYKLRQQPVEPQEHELPGGSFLWRSRLSPGATLILQECVSRRPHRPNYYVVMTFVIRSQTTWSDRAAIHDRFSNTKLRCGASACYCP